jgi:predicted ATPase
VTDVADATILHRLFSNMIRHGTVMVATSNRPPKDLYQNGISRDLFLPFIDLLYKQTVVHNLNSGIDYRLTGKHASKIYYK